MPAISLSYIVLISSLVIALVYMLYLKFLEISTSKKESQYYEKRQEVKEETLKIKEDKREKMKQKINSKGQDVKQNYEEYYK